MVKHCGAMELPKVIKISFHWQFAMRAAKSRLVSIPKSDLDSLEATLETLESQYVMNQLKQSEEDIQNGRVRKAREFLKSL